MLLRLGAWRRSRRDGVMHVSIDGDSMKVSPYAPDEVAALIEQWAATASSAGDLKPPPGEWGISNSYPTSQQGTSSYREAAGSKAGTSGRVQTPEEIREQIE